MTVLNHCCRIRRTRPFPSIAVKFGVFTGEIWPQFPEKSRLCSFRYTYMPGIVLQAIQTVCAKAKFSTDCGAVFQRTKKYTTGFGKDKEKDFSSLDGISRPKIGEKGRLFSER